MTSVGTGYDYSSSTYSPDGRIFQVEYANKAVENAGTTVGIRFKDGVVLGVEKLVQSKLLVPGSNRCILNVDEHVGLATSGMYADGKHLVKRAREEARQYLDIYRTPIPGKMIADRVCNYVQAHTLYSSVRPFGVTALLAAHDHNGPYLGMIEPSGVGWGYRGCAAGKGHKVAKTELEKLELDSLDAIQAVNEVARILLICHDDNKEKPIELEMTWIAPQTGFRHQRVPQDILEQARQFGEDALKARDMED